jgi:hypothetical protein
LQGSLWVECWALKRLGGCKFLPVAGDSFKVAIVSSEWDIESDNGAAGLDEFKVLGVNSCLGSSRLVEESDLLEETGLTELIKTMTGSLELRGSLVYNGRGRVLERSD